MPRGREASEIETIPLAQDPPHDAEDDPPGGFLTLTRPFYSPHPASCRPGGAAHVVSVARRRFRRRFFPGVSAREWSDWRWQMAHRIQSPAALQRMLHLSDEEEQALLGVHLPIGITPYYLSLIPPDEPAHPLRRGMVPSVRETLRSPGEADDPLHEERMSPVPGLVHRYPDRVLFLVHDSCAAYCRYCTRSRVAGQGSLQASPDRLQRMIDYIRATPTIRDVILSGGDPLLLADEGLEWLLARLQAIPHLDIIRIGTKIPVVLPQRITLRLTRMLRRFHPLFFSLHFMHPEECTPETQQACTLLADAGIPLGSQTVLLRGINDSVETMKELMHRLLRMRVRPYYIYQCDPISGSAHFRTAVEKGLEIIQGLRGHTSGYAVPTYVIDAPGGGGKIPLMPDAVIGRDGEGLILRNYEGGLFRYPDPLH